jgi:hypothetical protein
LGQTQTVETYVLERTKRKPDSYVRLSLDVDDYYRIRDQEKEEGKKKVEVQRLNLDETNVELPG